MPDQVSIQRALAGFFLPLGLLAASSAAFASEPVEASERSPNAHLVEQVSQHSFAQTVAKLRAAIEKRPVRLFAEIDHAKGAASADLELAASTLFIFGNPKGGTPLMTREPRMGIALPLKIHVFEAEGKVIVSYSDMAELVRQFGLDPNVQPIPNIASLLKALASEAAE